MACEEITPEKGPEIPSVALGQGMSEVPYAYPEGSRRAWTAEWIGPAVGGEDEPNRWIAFRASWSLDRVAESVPAHIAADSKYWLWVNGELVVFEGAVRRGPTPRDTYYDSLDLTPHLKSGENQIAVLLWYWGKDGFSHLSSGQPGLLFEARNGEEALVSGPAWKGILHPAYGGTGEPHPNRRLPEANIRFDAGADIRGWEGADFDDDDWPACRVLAASPYGELLHRQIPLWKDFGVHDYENAQELPSVSDGTTIVARLPYNAHFTPILEVDAPAGQVIEIRMDNYQGGSENNVRAEYVTREGRQSYESLGWMNGHEMHYTIPAGVTIHRLAYRETGYDTAFAGTFACDDGFLNRLHEKAVRTLYVTMRDTYMDCPDRERAQWWGDVVNELGEAFYALDGKSHALARKGIYELVNWQREDRSLFAPVPSDGCCGELPLQMLASVGRTGFWTYYWYTGEASVIADVYDRVSRYLSLWKIEPDGLILERPGDWTFLDWGVNRDARVLYNAWAHIAFDGQRRMAKLLGREGDIPAIEAKMASIEQHFNATFWTGSEYHAPGYEGETDDRANALAVVAGLAGPDKYDAIRRVLREEEHASPYMEKYVLESLYLMRFPEDAVARIHRRYSKMVESHYTTLWEGWGIGAEGFGGGTINHAWSGGPVTVLSQYGLGIAPTSAGFGTFEVLPQLGPLRRMETVVPTVAGEIPVRCELGADCFSLAVTVPEGTEAVLGVPKSAGPLSAVTLNGEGVETVTDDPHYHLLTVGPGAWEVIGRPTV
ncbi:MAG: alpha-L-rhamnosidase-related protein [Planctomycetota bacterium]|jgi:hypothetical protein